VTVPGFKYTPSSGFTGRDEFSWTITDGSGQSNETTCRIMVHPPEPGGMTVLLVVNELLYGKMNSEINQLRDDMAAEGYLPRILPWPDSKKDNDFCRELHDSLRAEYNTEDRFLAGKGCTGG